MCYPDIHADDGISDVDDVKELYDLGFQMVTCHCFSKGAIAGMMDYGSKVFKNRNTIFTENDDYYGADLELLKRFDRLGERKEYGEVSKCLEKAFVEAHGFEAKTERVR